MCSGIIDDTLKLIYNHWRYSLTPKSPYRKETHPIPRRTSFKIYKCKMGHVCQSMIPGFQAYLHWFSSLFFHPPSNKIVVKRPKKLRSTIIRHWTYTGKSIDKIGRRRFSIRIQQVYLLLYLIYLKPTATTNRPVTLSYGFVFLWTTLVFNHRRVKTPCDE